MSKESKSLVAGENPYFDFYQKMMCKKQRIDVFDPTVNEEARLKEFNSVNMETAEQYAWAIPDNRALHILTQFGPIVEMGAGRGYWARLLQLKGVDIVCFDLNVTTNATCEENKSWLEVSQGTPKDLAKHADRALMLAYPDDFDESDDSMALECLDHYNGEVVLHIGEFLGHTLCLPDPWGRTSAPEFQVRLAATYHKVLQVPLPNWHSSMDCLSVWKRTHTIIMEEDTYANIPPSEQLDLVMASPSTQHLVNPLDGATKVLGLGMHTPEKLKDQAGCFSK